VTKFEWVVYKGFRVGVDDQGQIFSTHTGRILKWSISVDGYAFVKLSRENKCISASVHRLVAATFCEGRTEERDEVNHKDLCKTNNASTNLEWVTRSENMRHAKDLGRGGGYPRKPCVGTHEDGTVLRLSYAGEASEYGIAPSSVCRALLGIYQKASGYTWAEL